MFWTRFIELCNEAGKSPNAVAAACGVKSSGTVTGWSKGSVPRAPILHKMAEYFHVSVDYLAGSVNDPFFQLDNERILQDINSYGGESEKAPTPEDERVTDLSPAFFRLKQGLEPYDLSESDADFLVEVYKAHIKKNQ